MARVPGIEITGTAGMSYRDIVDEVERGGRFVIYTYVVSVLVMTFRNPTGIRFVRGSESRFGAGFGCTMVSLVAGWWGFPWGFIYTPVAIATNCAGGQDVTRAVLAEMEQRERRLAQAKARTATTRTGAAV